MENPVIAVQSTEAAAQSAIQYFENMRNFLVAVGDMQLLTFEASDLEKVWFYMKTEIPHADILISWDWMA